MRESVFFTMGPQSSQPALSTLRTTVLSAARAVQGERMRARVIAAAKCLIIRSLRLFRAWDQRNRGASLGRPSAMTTRTAAVHRPILAMRFEEGLAQYEPSAQAIFGLR